MDVVDAWASLPPDLLLDIFLRLEAAAALRCTGVCKHWRRAIISNAASCLRPRRVDDCFVPGLLLGFFHNHLDTHTGRRHVMLQRLPGPSAARFPAASSLVHGDATDLAPYDELLSCRDGLVLLGGGRAAAQGLCLCSLMTGDRKFIPAAAFRACTYVLLTAYDLTASDARGGGGGGGEELEALILAVKEKDVGGGVTYQTFSTRDGAWGEVTRSPRFGHVTRIYTGSEVICRGGAVHWLAMGDHAGMVERTVAVDVRTGRTWVTALPEGCGELDCYGGLHDSPLRLATSGDGRLSVVRSFGGGAVEVWVLAGGDGWSLRRTIKAPCCGGEVWFSAFCPRSGCLLGQVGDKEIIVDAERGSCCLIGSVDDTTNHGRCLYPYEMDWSTYLAKMKHF
ncbi:unnamed protein product [Urochloa decumbens]|uniref:F-box domain-containing protein n=1 Tax=Urochloa decumbens TaxID=240449 RepID=A0ABC9A0E2_9POAL